IFSVGWFRDRENSRTFNNQVHELVIGHTYDLGVIVEDHPDPNQQLPRDPEGDYPISYTWGFTGSSSQFIRDLHSRFSGDTSREVYRSITIPNDPALKDTYHRVDVTARDRFGTP